MEHARLQGGRSARPRRAAARPRPALLAPLLLAVALLVSAAAAAAVPCAAPQDEPAPAERPSVVAIRVEGARRYTTGQILAALGQRSGEPYAPEQVSKGIETLWRAFHVKASVRAREVPGGLELEVEIEEMNVDLEPRFIGNAQVDSTKLRRWALLEDRGELYLYQADRVRQRLLEGYRREGYHFAEIDVVRRGAESGPSVEGALPDVIFEIREGPQVRVKDVVVRGNRSMPDRGMWWWRDGLQKLAGTQLDGPWLFNWLGEKYVAETLQADLQAMREVYRDRGWLDAVVELERQQFSADRSGVVLHVRVDEGRPWRVSALRIEGVSRQWNVQRQEHDESAAELALPQEELLALCRLRAGRRYDRSLQNEDARALREHYGARGWLSHPSLREDYFEFLEPVLHFDFERHEVQVIYRLAQGRQRWIREVVFSGATHTRDRVLRREIDVLPGELAHMGRIRRSLSRLNSTSFFSDDMRALEHRDPTFVFRPTQDPAWVDLEYQVEEGRVVNFQVQGGVDSNNGLFARLSLQMRNFDLANTPDSLWSTFGQLYDKEAFHGAGQRLEIDLMPGTVVDQYRFRFVEPDLLRSHFDRTSLDVELNLRERGYRFYDERRQEVRLRLGREFGRELSVFLGVSVQELRVSDLEAPLTGIDPPGQRPLPDSIYQQEGDSTLNALLLDLSLNRLDNTLNPREGLRLSWKNSLFGVLLGGNYQFVRSDADLDLFWAVGDSEQEVRPSWHLGLGLGLADAFGHTSETPYTERFFLGGSRQLRGFAFRGVGPNLRGNPLGGESSLDATLEYRLPLYSVTQPGTYRQIETFRLTFFSDAGILDPDPWSLDPAELRWSLGFGLGMVQPFPISINFGFPLRDGDGDRKQVFSFSIFSLWF